MTSELLPDATYQLRLQRASEDPADASLWDAVEDSARSLQRPDEAEAIYLEVLSRELAPEVAAPLAQRAVAFHDEWSADADLLVKLLDRAVALDPEAAWAFERLTMLFTVSERWTELLDLYDRAIARAPSSDPERRKALLDEAAHVAKDFADQPERSIRYLEGLFALDHGDAQVARSLERLYERHGHPRDLIALWAARLPHVPADAALASRLRIAQTWLDPIGDHAAALAATDDLLAHGGDEASACALLERVAAEAAAPVARPAIERLRVRYDDKGRADDALRVLGMALRVAAGPEERAEVHGELAHRLLDAGREVDAASHLAELVVLQPAHALHLRRLADLAERTGRHDLLADALARAADRLAQGEDRDDALRVELLVRAGNVRADVLNDPAGAAALFAQVLAVEGAPDAVALDVARRLAALLRDAGRDAERLGVLERLASLEPDASARRDVLGEAARLAEAAGHDDRALGAWRARLADDAHDADALDATVAILERAGRWEELVDALRARAAAVADPAARRADLVRVAATYTRRLGRVDDAILAWDAVREAFGEDAETVDALSSLLAAAGRHDELLALLGRAAGAEPDAARRALLLRRMGDVHRGQGDHPRAVARYREALDADAGEAEACEGLRQVLHEDGASSETGRAAVEALTRAYAETDAWERTLGLVEQRIEAAPDRLARARVLLESAALHEHRAHDLSAALQAAARAMPLAAQDDSLLASTESEVHRLAAAVGEWAPAVLAYQITLRALGATPGAGATTRGVAYRLGEVLESRVGDLPEALAAFDRVARDAPGDLAATLAVVRVGARTDRWDAVARALVTHAAAVGALGDDLVEAVEAAAAAHPSPDAAWTSLAATTEEAAAEVALPAALARDVDTRLGVWHRDRRGDRASAEAAFARAISRDPRDPRALRMLAELRRDRPDGALVETLLALADAEPAARDAIAARREAAEVAAARGADDAAVRDIVTGLLERAAELWRALDASGEDDALRDAARGHAAWAVRALVDLHARRNDPARAVEMLVAGAGLPFERAAAHALRKEAAERAARDLGDAARAASLYEGVLEENPADLGVIARLTALYREAGRADALLRLRAHELSLTDALDERLAIRLDIAEIHAAGGDLAGKEQALRANLAERPGHAPSVEALAALLEGAGRHADLADLLEAQAAALDADPAADADGLAPRLWARVARVAESPLGDVPRAIAAHERVVARAAEAESLDALARMHAARGEHAAAVRYLTARLDSAEGDALRATVARLAQAHVATGRPAEARAVLERHLARDPGAREARAALADLYRAAEAWEPLAALLTDERVEAADRLASLREAADVLLRRVGDAARAVPVLERAAALAPDDRAVKAALADALRAAGRLDEARALLDGLVEGYGRQRPLERAGVHFQIARIAEARGDLAEALAQLELASSIDMGHTGIFRLLGDLSRRAGQLDRAERAYRALLMLVRRQTGAAAASPDAVGPSEVLFELHDIAQRLGQEQRARETLESAFETASRSDVEARRFERAVRAAGQPELLLRAVEMRLATERDPVRAAELRADRARALAMVGRREEALDAWLAVLDGAPGDAAAHDAARSLARESGRAARYAEALVALAGRASGEDAAALRVRLGDVRQDDLRDLRGAAEAYTEAEPALSGDALAGALRSLARLGAETGDAALRARALGRLIDAGVDDAAPLAWELAALQLTRDDEAARADGAAWLAWALERDADGTRAAGLLRASLDARPGHAAVAELYLQVARDLGDEGAVRDAIARRAACDDVAMELLREGVDLAALAEDGAGADALLRRAVAVAEARGELGPAAWALEALGERARDAGELAAAVGWLRRAADASEGERARELGLEVASLAAGPLGDLPLAAEVYESLRRRDPAERRVWEPLLEVYRVLGDRAGLDRLIDETVGHVFETGDRNRLRRERARLLADDPAREGDVVSTLRDALDEDPDDAEATRMLADLFERTGRDEDLADLLNRQFDRAKDAGDAAAASALGLRVAALLAPTRRGDALDALRSALDVAPESAELLQRLLATLTADDDPYERAALTERLLALETGPAAAALALSLAGLRTELNDDDGAERALERGAAAAPDDATVRARLEERYLAREDFAALARLREAAANRLSDAAARGAALREVAAIHGERLGDASERARLLVLARGALPRDPGLLAECVDALTAAGRADEAEREVTAAIDAGAGDPARLLRLRAAVRAGADDLAGAAADLEDAYARAPDAAAAAELAGALDRALEAAAARGDEAAERATTMRLIEVLPAAGDPARAVALLASWAERHPDDVMVLERLAAEHEAAGRWAEAAEVWQALVVRHDGEARTAAALRLADACERAGAPQDARGGLEHAYQSARENATLRQRLRAVAAAEGASQDVAALWTDEAEFATDEGLRFEALKRAAEAWLEPAGDPTQAVPLLQRALEWRPADHDATVLLSDAFTMTERLEDASRLLEEAIAGHKGRRSKELAILQQRMAHVAFAANDHSVEMLWLNAALDTDMQNGQIAAELADVSMELGNHEVALKALRAITLMKSPAPMSRAQAFLKQGVIALAQGDQKKAVFLARKALSEDATLDDAHQFLAQLGAE
ncbi:MAG: tetratricopeptide repeat protein [Polyangiales bacterium]